MVARRTKDAAPTIRRLVTDWTESEGNRNCLRFARLRRVFRR